MSRSCHLFLLASLAAAPLGAQVRLGLLAGGVSANVTTATVDQIPNKSSRTGFLVGISATRSFGKYFAFGPELTWVQKGVKAQDNSHTVNEDIKVSYLELPLLLRVNLATGSLRPYLLGGPSFAIKTGCKLRLYGAGTDTTRNCQDVNADVESSDFGAMVGAGIGFGRFGVSVRYDMGMKNINKKSVGNDAVKNRTLMGVVSVSM
jgi:hypothetical protein